jgi:hypothetical protein
LKEGISYFGEWGVGGSGGGDLKMKRVAWWWVDREAYRENFVFLRGMDHGSWMSWVEDGHVTIRELNT